MWYELLVAVFTDEPLCFLSQRVNHTLCSLGLVVEDLFQSLHQYCCLVILSLPLEFGHFTGTLKSLHVVRASSRGFYG